jgi:hypothetical protein
MPLHLRKETRKQEHVSFTQFVKVLLRANLYGILGLRVVKAMMFYIKLLETFQE